MITLSLKYRLVGSPEWRRQARAVEAEDQSSRTGDYLSDALDEIARLRLLLGLNPEDTGVSEDDAG